MCIHCKSLDKNYQNNMKRYLTILSFVAAILVSQVAHSQNTVWANPDCYNDIYKTGLTIDNVKFYSDATVIDFTYHNGFAKTGWIQINQESQIKVYPSGQTFNMVSAQGIPYAPEKCTSKAKTRGLSHASTLQFLTAQPHLTG